MNASAPLYARLSGARVSHPIVPIDSEPSSTSRPATQGGADWTVRVCSPRAHPRKPSEGTAQARAVTGTGRSTTMNEAIHAELEKLKNDDRTPAPEKGTWQFSARGVNSRFNAELTINEAYGQDFESGPEFGRGELVLRLPFEDCGTPLNYIAHVLKAMNLEAER